MKAYLVRQIGKEGDDKKIVGIVKAKTLFDLWMAVEEVFNPHELQYMVVAGTGGVLLKDGEVLSTGGFLEQQFDNQKHPFHQWKTFVELAGGERFFSAMFEKWYSVGDHVR